MALLLLYPLLPVREAAAALFQRAGAPVRAVALPAAPVLPVLPAPPSAPSAVPALPSLPAMPAPRAAALPVSPASAPKAPAARAVLARLAGPEQPGAQAGGPRAPAPASEPARLDAAYDGSAPACADPGEVSGAPGSPAPPLPPSAPGPRRSWRAAVPNLITGLNLTSGLGAAMLASQGSLLPAAGLILLANVFDALDGRAARLLKVSSPLGAQLDSLADVVSFGAAPALLIYHAALAPLGALGFAAAAVFAGAGAFRLARFNLTAAQQSENFTGLPIPGGAGVLVAVTLAAASWPVSLAVTLATAAAMASRLPYPTFKKSGAPLAGAAGLAAAVPLAVMGQALWIPAAVFGMYLATGPAAWLYKGSSEAFRKELKRKAFHQLAWLYVPAVLIAGAHAAPALAAWTALVGLIDLTRLRVARARPFFERWFGGIIREKEQARMSGSFYVALGVSVTALLFGAGTPVFFGAVAALALGDAVSPLVGLRFGWKPYKALGTQRSLDGTLAGLAAAYAIALASGCGPAQALFAALAFSVVDTLPVKPDDNLWIPIVFGAALWLLR